MKAINEKFCEVAEYYFLTEDGKVFNQKTNKYLKPDSKSCYRFMLLSGKMKAYSIKTLMREVYNKNYCIDLTESLEGESWRFIPRTNEMYACSNLGRIKSLIGLEARILNPTLTKMGYLRLQIVYPDGTIASKFVHSLVCETWLAETPLDSTTCCHHKNAKTDNRVKSLQVMKKEDHIKLHRELNKSKESNDDKKSSTNS